MCGGSNARTRPMVPNPVPLSIVVPDNAKALSPLIQTSNWMMPDIKSSKRQNVICPANRAPPASDNDKKYAGVSFVFHLGIDFNCA